MKSHCSRSIASIALIAALFSGPVQAGVADLSWMTGTWAGPAGPDNTLEENWTMPADGSIGALVRMRGNGGTSMVELIVVEETADGLTLHLQQWSPGFEPRTGSLQEMKLESIGERTVTFKATSPGGLNSLTYSRPDDQTFTIRVETADGNVIPLELKAL